MSFEQTRKVIRHNYTCTIAGEENWEIKGSLPHLRYGGVHCKKQSTTSTRKTDFLQKNIYHSLSHRAGVP